MAVVLAISSQVARGHVGLSAVVPVLQAMGHEVIALPTVLLSNHPGHASVTSMRVTADVLEKMLETLDNSGWLGGVDAVLTGYLPSVEHVRMAARAIAAVREQNPLATYVCDPVIGDDPKGVYIALDAAKAIRADLLPLADCATPNRFELAWLAGMEVTDLASGVAAARTLGPPVVFATSIPARAAGEMERIATLRVTVAESLAAPVEHRTHVPHGTGDMMSALILAHMLAGEADDVVLSHAAGAIEAVITASEGRDELALIASRREWRKPRAVPLERVE